MKKCGYTNCKPCTFDGYELTDRLFLYDFLRQFSDSALIDVGAHVGLYGYSISSMLAADKERTGADHRCRIISIEPDNRVFSVLTDNVGSANTWQCAAWQTEAILWFTANGQPHGHVLVDRPDADCLRIQGRPIDDMVGSMPDIVAIKIDTEGTEYRVLAGALSLLQQATSVAMIVEISNDHLEPYGDTVEHILALCDDLELTAVDERQLIEVDKGFKRNVRFVKGYTP